MLKSCCASNDQSDQSLWCSLAPWESSGFTCGSPSITLGSPAWHWGKDPNPLDMSPSPLCHTEWFWMSLEVVFGAVRVVMVLLVQGRNDWNQGCEHMNCPVLQIPLNALAGKPAGHQGSCWCRSKLLCLPERTAKFHFSWEKIILDTKPTQGKTPTPLITQSDVLHPFPGGDLCPLTRVGNKAPLIECLCYWFTAFQVVQDLLCPDRNCSKVWFFFLLLLKVALCFPLVFLSSLSPSHKSV